MEITALKTEKGSNFKRKRTDAVKKTKNSDELIIILPSVDL